MNPLRNSESPWLCGCAASRSTRSCNTEKPHLPLTTNMKIACVQCNVIFGDPLANARKAVEDQAAQKTSGVDIAVYPEAYLTGYCVDSMQGAASIATCKDSEPIQILRAACDEQDIMAVVGFAELGHGDSSGLSASSSQVYNTAVLLEPGKPTRFYRKSHLPELG